ncbi:DUF971 domain-containing protein [Trinickia violacea]|uniref:DUF971 domain-containing protein n=1 Tax=Trinickia violacea TaxID=2571746 RepID=A0A4P8J019_9BURK|nr:DUF971 domain-containing protein [Trinickia violacea]QCP54057.1 DUF971 domain-containing protein [Trinickia violacea]
METPQRIALNRTVRTLTVHWQDGRVDEFSDSTLRANCPCSACRRIRLQGGTIAIADEVAVFGIQPMGYGIQLVFSDGHSQGIYPWVYLDALAPRALVLQT